jgi:hypothetical protein
LLALFGADIDVVDVAGSADGEEADHPLHRYFFN